MPTQLLAHNPAAYLRPAFDALNWPDLAFDAAMRCPMRRDIIELIATCWPAKPMENIVSISRINWLAIDAAQRCRTAREALPYSEHSAAGQLFAKCFDLEKKRLSALALPAQSATENVANATEGVF